MTTVLTELHTELSKNSTEPFQELPTTQKLLEELKVQPDKTQESKLEKIKRWWGNAWPVIIPSAYGLEAVVWLLSVKHWLPHRKPFPCVEEFMILHGHDLSVGISLALVIQLACHTVGLFLFMFRAYSIYVEGIDLKCAKEETLFNRLLWIPAEATRQRAKRLKLEVSMLEKSGFLALSLTVITVLSRDLKLDSERLRLMLQAFAFGMWLGSYMLWHLRTELLRLVHVLERASKRAEGFVDQVTVS